MSARLLLPLIPNDGLKRNVTPLGRFQELFTQHCASCHGAGAQGTTRAPSLHTASVQMMSDDALVQFLTDGDLQKGMPSWSRLPEERRWQLTRFVKSLSGSAGTERQGLNGR
jgi:mono/diheme cytochrome c family protein